MLRTLFDHKNIIVINHIDSLLHSGSTVPCRQKAAFVNHLEKVQQSNVMLIYACVLNIAAVDEYIRGEFDEEVSSVIPDEKKRCDLLMDLSCGTPSLYQLTDVQEIARQTDGFSVDDMFRLRKNTLFHAMVTAAANYAKETMRMISLWNP